MRAISAARRSLTGTSPGRLAGRRFLRHRPGVIGACLLAVLIASALGVPWLEQALAIDSTRIDLLARNQGSSPQHWLGTDELGRDLGLRLLYGGRVSLTVGVMGACLAAALGTGLGLIAGYFGGRLDAVLMRLTDGMIALPLLPLLIVFAALDLEKVGLPREIVESESISLYRITAIVALFGWTTAARLVRGATLSARGREYVLAARGLGASPGRIMLVHVLPNVISPLIIATTLSVGNVVLLESVLSFLGLGIQPPIPSWGNMLSNAQELMRSAPALALYPGAFIFVTVLAVNFVGDALQEAFDPRAGTFT